ncbi:MAG: hypothetical protein H7177_08300 [Rhizobacter sp.]|nr:hypothetical protein [Bacteriovorax sp.]
MLIPESKPELPALKNQKGQTFVEFILVLMILATISFGFMKGFSHLIGARWEVMLKIIARPNTIEFPSN